MYLLFITKGKNLIRTSFNPLFLTAVSTMPDKTFTNAELSEFDGKKNEKIYVALNFNVYDVTEKGQSHYGKGSCSTGLRRVKHLLNGKRLTVRIVAFLTSLLSTPSLTSLSSSS